MGSSSKTFPACTADYRHIKMSPGARQRVECWLESAVGFLAQQHPPPSSSSSSSSPRPIPAHSARVRRIYSRRRRTRVHAAPSALLTGLHLDAQKPGSVACLPADRCFWAVSHCAIGSKCVGRSADSRIGSEPLYSAASGATQ